MAYRTRNIHNNYQRVSTLCESEIVLRGQLIERGTFIITISAFLLGVKANLFCIYGLYNEEYPWHVCISTSLYSPITIGITSFSIGTNRTIGTNGPSELPCTQPGQMHIHQQNHWNDVLFYWYQSCHWYQWTIGLLPDRAQSTIVHNKLCLNK